MTQRLLIAGWSARAAVQSARRAGLDVAAIDAFLDADLRRDAATCRRLTDVRHLPALAAELPPSEWLYIGGLENHPRIVADVSRRHRLLGTAPAALRRVRDPCMLQRAVRRGGFAFPETRSLADAATVPNDGTWLVKRRRSAGGVGVRPYVGDVTRATDAYLQQFVAGASCGATFVAAAGRCRLLGVCRQLCTTSHRETPYLYGGSIGPLVLPSRVMAELQRLGDLLAGEFELVGLFGVDVVIDRADDVRPLEVNPRYTASVDVLERATGATLLDLHLRACRDGTLPTTFAASSSVVHGKRIVYYDGPADCVVPASLTEQLLGSADVADVPAAETRVRPGEPLSTVFAAADDDDEVAGQLIEHERRLLESLRGRQ